MSVTLGVRTPSGNEASFAVRDGTNDGALVAGIVTEDEYGLRGRTFSGWALDIGAHIGTVAIMLAVDNPRLQVVAVEALPDNVAVLREAVGLNGLGNRVHVIEAAADEGTDDVPIAYGWSWSLNQPNNWVQESRFIGGMVPANESSQVAMCQPVSLGTILERYDIDRVAVMKIDCEGCEHRFLPSPEIGRVDLIVGEFHDHGEGGIESIHALLDATHEVEHLSGVNVGQFRAVAR